MASNKEKLQIAPPTLMECKYDHDSNDIFLYLTKEGFTRLRKGDDRGNFTLTVIHEETRARFEVINSVSNSNYNDVLEVLDIRLQNQPDEWYRVKLNDKGYNQIKNALDSGEDVEHTTVSTRYEGGFKVFLTVDEEMVKTLAESRLKNKTKISQKKL